MVAEEVTNPVGSITPSSSIDALVMEITKKPHLFSKPLQEGDILQVRITGYQNPGSEPVVYDAPLPLYRMEFFIENGFQILPYFSIGLSPEKVKLPQTLQGMFSSEPEKIYVQVAHHIKNYTQLKQFMDAGNDFYGQLLPDAVNDLAKGEEGIRFMEDMHKEAHKDTTIFMALSKQSDNMKKQEVKRKKEEEKRKNALRNGQLRAPFEP